MSKKSKRKQNRFPSSTKKKSNPLDLVLHLKLWWKDYSIVVIYFSLFLFSLILFYIFYSSRFFMEHLALPIIHFQGEVASYCLQLLGYNTHIEQHILQGSGQTLSIMKGCDGIEPIALYIIGVLLTPFSLSIRFRGLWVGLLVLLGLNIFRIILLFGVKVHLPEWFDVIHIHGGYVLFMLITIAIWLIWTQWALKQKRQINVKN